MEKHKKTPKEHEESVETHAQTESAKTDQEPENTKDDYEKTIAVLSEQVETLQDKLLRQLAESENIRTRSTKLIEEARDYAIFGFTKDLIPVMDNLSRALEHLPQNLGDEMQNIVEGIKMTKDELESVFRTHSLESIAPQAGDKFDYHSHHAISQIVTDDFEDGTVVSTMQAGYRIKDRLIRPAAVTVAKSK